MSRIRIKNLGPIKEGYTSNDGWLYINKNTIFIGNQGSGKSTAAKIISTLKWLEKSLYKGILREVEITKKGRFQNYYCEYQNLKNYFRDSTEIEYQGEEFNFQYKNKQFNIARGEHKENKFLTPKIMYVPAERNFISTVSQPDKLKYLPKPLYTFLDEYERAKQQLDEGLKIPVNDINFYYDKKKKNSTIKGADYELLLEEASSGLQSAIPLFLVSRYLTLGLKNQLANSTKDSSVKEMQELKKKVLNLLTNEKLTEEMRSTALEILSDITKNDCFINIVEEPEQNLFPTSQWEILKTLLTFNNHYEGNELIITTHSPYIINYLTLSAKAFYVQNQISQNCDNITLEKLYKIVPKSSMIDGNDLSIYEFNEKNGKIIKLEKFDGLPSDQNYLNEKMGEFNEQFVELLEIEDSCR